MARLDLISGFIFLFSSTVKLYIISNTPAPESEPYLPAYDLLSKRPTKVPITWKTIDPKQCAKNIPPLPTSKSSKTELGSI